MKKARRSQLSMIYTRSSSAEGMGFSPWYRGDLEARNVEIVGAKPRGMLAKIADLFCRRWLVVVGVAATTVTGVYWWTVEQLPEYRGTFQLLISSSDELGGLDEASQLTMLQSPQVMADILENIQSRYPQVDYRFLFNDKSPGRLELRMLEGTKILEVSYQDSEPQKIQFILEAITSGYLEYHQGLQRPSENSQKLEMINQKINPLVTQVNNLKREIVNLQQEHLMITPEVTSRQISDRLGMIETERLQTQTQLQEEKSRYLTLQQQLGLDPQQAMMASALTNSPRYQTLLQKLLAVETEVAVESARFKEASPQIQSLLDQRNHLLPLLQEEAVRVLGQDLTTVDPSILSHQDSLRMGLIQQMMVAAHQIEMLQVRDRVLQTAATSLQEYSQSLPEVIRRYRDLNQQLETATTRLNDLSDRQAELELTIEPPVRSWQLIAPPMIPRQRSGQLETVSPNIPLNLALGGLAGLGLGMIIAQLVDRLNNVFHNSEEIAENTPIPLLGVIPASDDALMLPANSRLTGETDVLPNLSMVPCGIFHEAFRSLTANLRHLATESPINSCVISSARPADGKSTVALNLAIGAAAMGQRVLLVDADLRNPRIHSMLGVSNLQGLSDAIAGNLEIETLIRRSPSDENLFILTSGPLPVDPTRMLASARMQEVMAQLRQQFDLIVYDTAPLLGLADANLLASHTNGLMMVVGLGKTDRSAFNLALRELEMAGVPVLGMVANGDRQETNYYYSQR